MIKFKDGILRSDFDSWITEYQSESGKNIDQKIVNRVFRQMEIKYSNFNIATSILNLENAKKNWRILTIEACYIANSVLEFKEALKKLAFENIQENITKNITTINDERLRNAIHDMFEFQHDNIRYQTAIGTKFTNKNTLQDLLQYIREIGILDDLGMIKWWVNQYESLVINRDIPISEPCKAEKDEENPEDQLIELICQISEEVAKKEIKNSGLRKINLESKNDNLLIETQEDDINKKFTLEVKNNGNDAEFMNNIKLKSIYLQKLSVNQNNENNDEKIATIAYNDKNYLIAKLGQILNFIEEQKPFIINNIAKVNNQKYSLILKNRNRLVIPVLENKQNIFSYVFVGEDSKLNIEVNSGNFSDWLKKLEELNVKRTQSAGGFQKKYTFSDVALTKLNLYKDEFKDKLEKNFKEELEFGADYIQIDNPYDEYEFFKYIYSFVKY